MYRIASVYMAKSYQKTDLVYSQILTEKIAHLTTFIL